MQNQQNIQKIFFEQLKPGDYVDARYGDDDWKVAKVIERQNKYLTIIYDGMQPNNQQVYINPMRVKPFRSVTIAYTGPYRNIYSSISSIQELTKHIQLIDIILKTTQPPLPYKITQYLRGQLFTTINSLLLNYQCKFTQQDISILNNFFIQLIGRIGKICQKAKQYVKEYFQSNTNINNNNKFIYLVNYKIAIIYSLAQLLYLINMLINTNQPPKLLKNYKNEISQQNLINYLKQYLPLLISLCTDNDGTGRWLPTYIRLQISKILLKYKEQDKFINISYQIKDYLQFYNYWPQVLLLCSSQVNQKKFINYIHIIMCSQSPFDAKLKSLVMLRKLLDKDNKDNNYKQLKLSYLSQSNIIQLINSKKIIDSLLKYFNPQIFKRYIPILKIYSQISTSNSKKSFTQGQIDDLFKIMKTSHQSEINLIYQIIVSISEFINIDTLDNIYIDIQKNIDINNQTSIKFVKDFTIKAIQNFNMNKNKGFFSTIIGRKKCSNKFQYYGLNLFFKEIQDGNGKILSKNIAFVINNIGAIFQNQCFHHQRLSYMQTCIINIDKKQSYGQSIRMLQQILCTYSPSAYIGDSQQSIVGKLDDKYKLVDTLINGLQPLEKQINGQTSKNVNNIKVNFQTSIKYCYSFLEQFGMYLKNPLQLRHINFLWHMPHVFQFLRKPRESNDPDLPIWKRKYYKRLNLQIIKGILTQILKHDENIIPTQQCFDAVNQLILSFNLNKSLQLTQRATIRYKNLANIVGLNFYYKFLQKLIAMNRNDWKKNKKEQKNIQLVYKVIKTIFQIHLRPTEYNAINIKCQNLLNCLMKVIKSIYKDNLEICVNSIQIFFDLIKGRLFKDIAASGKLDILVSYESRQKTITLPKSATILKLRNAIMQVYKIKWNFQMFNTHLKRQVKFTEEQDFSINAMGQAIKGPTIIVRKVQQGQIYPIAQAYQKFMGLIQQQQQFYKIVFGLLKVQTQASLHSRIWKIIEKVPVNRVTKNKIKNCKDFTKKDWVQFLLPNVLQELQYSINIVYSQLGNTKWMQDFKKTQGDVVIQQLFLTMLKSVQPLSQKIKTNLSKIILKILEHSNHSHQQKKGQDDSVQIKKIQQKQSKQNMQNLQKISKKIMEQLQNQIKKYQKFNKQMKQSQKQSDKKLNVSIQYLNLMMKILLTLSLKNNCPEIQIIIKYFLHDGVLLNISDIILFQPKDTDTTFFTEDILQRITLQLSLQKSYKIEILRQFLTKYLNYNLLVEKASTQNYFIFLITFLQNFDKDKMSEIYKNNPQIIKCIKDYIEQTLNCKQNNQDKQKMLKELKLGQSKKLSTERIEPNEQMVHGCFKLLNQTYCFEIFNYDIQKIFIVLVDKFILSEPHLRQNQVSKDIDQKLLNKSPKIKNKYKKILYEIVKLLIFQNKQLLNIFIEKVAPKLQKAQWRRNAYSSWNLQQQKKQKKFFCGLQNLTATCYINCLFQQLFMIKRFSDRFINIDSLAYKQLPQSNQIYQLQKLLTYLKYGNKRSYTTRPFCQSFITYEGVPIDPAVQNDADEFFNALMDKIQSFLKSSGHHDILQDTFEGKLSNQLNCQGCPHSSQKIQPFMSIGLNIKNKKNLEAALDGYVQGQILDGDNAYFCQKCQKKVRTMKRLCIKQIPNILVVVLKRFTFNFDEMRKIKINDQLKFPQQLNVKKYTSEFNLGQQCKPDDYYDYKLRGVVVHAGTSQGGHYYSFIKQGQEGVNGGGKWYQFNDQIIEQADYKRIEQEGFGGQQKDSQFKVQKYKNAYILLYQKNKLIQKCPSQIIEQPKQNEMMIQTEPFQSHLSQLVISENRNSDFLSIILDALFIRLCQNISMCGQEKAHHFILLYFHTVLLRDRNKEQYVSNIYRVILTLMDSSVELSYWFIQQIDQNYIKQFLLQAQKLGRYFCLGLVIEAIKILEKYQKQSKNRLKSSNNIKNMIQAIQITKKLQQNKEQSETQQIKQNQSNSKQPQTQPQPEMQSQNQKSKQNFTNNSELQKIISKEPVKQKQQAGQVIQILQQKYKKAIKDLIPRLVSCVKAKGMTPFAKIFTFLSSKPEYRQELQKYEYAERVAQIILSDNSRYYKKIQYQPIESYFGHQSLTCKQKELQLSYSFLIQSIRFYPSILTKQQILNLLASAQSRPTTKSLTYMLTKTIQTPQQALQTLQLFQIKLMDDKYKRQDIEKYMFMIRYYYLFADDAKNRCIESNSSKVDDQSRMEFIQSVKNICLSSLAIVIKANQTSYLLMEIVIVEINKIAWKSQDFKQRWIEKVNNNQGLFKALTYWVNQSKRPIFLQRNQQWKRKVANLSYQQKQTLVMQNQRTQQQRTLWMLVKKEKQQKSKKQQRKQMDNSQQQSRKAKILQQDQIPEIHSDLDLTSINKNIIIGFKCFKIVDRLGILTKVQDDRGLCKWAILEKNQIQAYLDF